MSFHFPRNTCIFRRHPIRRMRGKTKGGLVSDVDTYDLDGGGGLEDHGAVTAVDDRR